MATIQEMQKELAHKRAEHAQRFEAIKSAPDHQKHGLLEEINRAEAELQTLHDKVVEAQALSEMERRNRQELKTLRHPVPTVPFAANGQAVGFQASQGIKSLGEQLIERTELQRFQETTGQKAIALDFPFQSVREWKATLAEGTLTGYERVPSVVVLGEQMPHVADLLAQGETTQPTVRYIRENSYTNAATAIAEGAQKPEATFDLVEADAPVRKIAVVARVSDEMFADFPAVRDYVNERLPFMVEQAEDAALLNGNGTAPNLRGILQTLGILSGGALNQGADTLTDPIPHPILRAMTQVQSASFFEPTGLVMNPVDWQNVRLMRTGDGGSSQGLYIWGNPSEKGPGTIWGLPVVSTTTIAAKTVLVGAFRLGAQIFRRQGITLDMTNADGNDFQFNRIAIRCETRLALCVYRPTAFGKVVLQ
ncbi:MAG: phage major capsid protein [Abitibacteriaceae bacterium]|nr:phage major capsid protein [Abditibacteriaceae bacterium]